MASNLKKINLKYRKELEDKINEFLEYLKYQHFSENSIKKYNSHLQKYYYYCIKNNIKNFYSKFIISNYIDSLNLDHCLYFVNSAKNVLNKFIDFYFNGSFRYFYIEPVLLKSKQFNHILTLYEEALDRKSTRLNSSH